MKPKNEKLESSPYEEGFEAYGQGILYSRNPYPFKEKYNHESWNEGWSDAELIDLNGGDEEAYN